MRIPANVEKCVSFLGRVITKGDQADKVFGGTGFLVSLPSKMPGVHYVYAVTAKHVAQQMSLGNWVMRVNTRFGWPLDITSTKDHQWFYHPTEAACVDVAVSPIVLPIAADCTPIPEDMFVNDAIVQHANIGPGDEVIISGLFTKLPGRFRNIPIVRTGNISMMPAPGEKVPGVTIDDQGVDAEAYLIEARSIGGLSGSPVFTRCTVPVKMPVQRLVDGTPTDATVSEMWCSMPGKLYFLGLAHGHWEILAEEKNEAHVRRPSQKEKKEKEVVNLGIAIVVPANKIREVLYHPELVERRKKGEQKLTSEGTSPAP